MDNTNEIEMFSPEEMQSPFEAIKETDGEGRECRQDPPYVRVGNC